MNKVSFILLVSLEYGHYFCEISSIFALCISVYIYVYLQYVVVKIIHVVVDVEKWGNVENRILKIRDIYIYMK